MVFGSVGFASASVPLEERAGLPSVDGVPERLPSAVPEPPVVKPPALRPRVEGSAGEEAASEAPAPSPSGGRSEASGAAPVVPGSRSVAGAVDSIARGDAGTAIPAPGHRAVSAPGRAGGSRDAVSRAGGATSGTERRAIGPRVTAPVRELLAHVWPAVALAPLGRALIASLAVVASGPLPVGRVAAAAAPLSPSEGAWGAAASKPGPVQGGSPDPASFSSALRWRMGLLLTLITALAALVGVVAVARLAVGENLFSLRWLR